MRIWELWVCVSVMTAAVLVVHGDGNAGSSLDGSAADLAWLLVQEEETPSSQPQIGAQVSVRRITPKSVFMAPTFTSCSEGYRQDSLGRCVKVVKVNPSAQWDFFLHKLNSMYGAAPEPNKRPANTGPFRLPIPLATEPTTTTVRITTTELPTTSTLPSTTTILSTTTEEQTTYPPFVIVVANTTEQPSTVTAEPNSSTQSSTISTTTNEPTTTEIATTICADCDYPTVITTTAQPFQQTTTVQAITSQAPAPIKTTVIFPDENHVHRRRPPTNTGGTMVRFPEPTVAQIQQQQHSPHWWPHSWEHRLWQPPSAYYQPPRLTSYHGHREGRPAWQK